MTAPSSGRDDSTIRGAIVLAVAIVIGLALLTRTTGGNDDDSKATTTTVASGATTTTTLTATLAQTPTTPPVDRITGETNDPKDVTVAVLNGTTKNGWADSNSKILSAEDFVTVASGAATDSIVETVIYAAADSMPDAQAVKEFLKLPDAPIKTLPTTSLAKDGKADDNADVVVVLGTDSVKN